MKTGFFTKMILIHHGKICTCKLYNNSVNKTIGIFDKYPIKFYDQKPYKNQ